MDVDLIVKAFALEGCSRPHEAIERYYVEQSAGLRLLLVAVDISGVAGYVSLCWDADHPPFRRLATPEIQDLSVLPSRRRRGIATALLDEAERVACQRATEIGLSVGLYSAYGPAHRLYAGRGFLPDGGGATSGGLSLVGGETVSVDDSLVLHLTKQLR